MSVYKNFQKIEKIVDCSLFVEKMELLMTYMKLAAENTNVGPNNIFDWIALIDSGNYDDYEIEQDILSNGAWSESDVLHIQSKLIELGNILEKVLCDFETKTKLSVYLRYDDEMFCSCFEFYVSQIFDMALDFYDMKNKVTT